MSNPYREAEGDMTQTTRLHLTPGELKQAIDEWIAKHYPEHAARNWSTTYTSNYHGNVHGDVSAEAEEVLERVDG